jgi:hypothetical protein
VHAVVWGNLKKSAWLREPTICCKAEAQFVFFFKKKEKKSLLLLQQGLHYIHGFRTLNEIHESDNTLVYLPTKKLAAIQL